MIDSDALYYWSWMLFVDQDNPEKSHTERELLEHHRVAVSAYKLFMLAVIHAGGCDPNLEFSISTCSICRMAGLTRNTVKKCLEAAQGMGHISYTGRLTSCGNPARRTRIYRICALDTPGFIRAADPQLRIAL